MLGIQFDILLLGVIIGAVAALVYVRRGDRTSGPTVRRRGPGEPS